MSTSISGSRENTTASSAEPKRLRQSCLARALQACDRDGVHEADRSALRRRRICRSALANVLLIGQCVAMPEDQRALSDVLDLLGYAPRQITTLKDLPFENASWLVEVVD